MARRYRGEGGRTSGTGCTAFMPDTPHQHPTCTHSHRTAPTNIYTVMGSCWSCQSCDGGLGKLFVCGPVDGGGDRRIGGRGKSDIGEDKADLMWTPTRVNSSELSKS